MQKAKLSLLTSDLIELVKKHCEDPKDINYFFFGYLPAALVELVKHNELVPNKYAVMGDGFLTNLDKLLCYERVKALLPLFAYIETEPDLFSDSFGDADFYVRNIERKITKWAHRIETKNIKFKLVDVASTSEAIIVFESNSIFEKISFSETNENKTLFTVEYRRETDFDREYPETNVLEFTPNYTYDSVYFINNTFAALMSILEEIKYEKELLTD